MRRFYKCEDIKREVVFINRNAFWPKIKPMEFEIVEGVGQETLFRGQDGRLPSPDKEDN